MYSNFGYKNINMIMTTKFFPTRLIRPLALSLQVKYLLLVVFYIPKDVDLVPVLLVQHLVLQVGQVEFDDKVV